MKMRKIEARIIKNLKEVRRLDRRMGKIAEEIFGENGLASKISFKKKKEVIKNDST